MPHTTLFFDLDDTLYSNQNGLWQALRVRMGQYMVEKLKLPAEIVPELRRRYFQTYGTTLRGLQKHHHVDADDYLAYVHDLPLEEYLQPDPALQFLLNGLPQRRFIFTNADALHARRVMDILGVADCFDGIIDIKAMGFACKPEPAAYQHALQLTGCPRSHECVMLDDSTVNLAPARLLGFTTVLVGSTQPPDKSQMVAISSIHDLPRALPELWLNHS